MFSEESTRLDVLNIFFYNYINLLYDYSDLYGSSKDMEVLVLMCPSEKEGTPIKYYFNIFLAVLKSLKICRYIGVNDFLKGIYTLKNMSSEWIENIVKTEYTHLDLIVVQEKYRGQKFMSKMMKQILKEIDKNKAVCTLETQNINNVEMYKHFGFQIVDTINLHNSDIKQYCMIYKVKQK